MSTKTFAKPLACRVACPLAGGGGGGDASAPSDLEQLLLSQSDASPYRPDTARLQDTSANAGTYREKLTQEVFQSDGVSISADTGLDLVGTTETDFTILIAAKIASGASASDFIIGDDQTSGTRRWAVRHNANGHVEWFASPDGGVGAYHRYEGDTVIDDDALHFIAARVEDGVLTGLEIDGVADSITDTTVGSPAGTVRTGGENIYIGSRAGADSFLEANFHFAAIATGSDAADLWAERETVRTGFEPTASCDGIWYFEEGNTANVINAVADTPTGTIANYVSSARPVDTDRTYTIGNRLGYSPRAKFGDGDGTWVTLDSNINAVGTDFDITAKVVANQWAVNLNAIFGLTGLACYMLAIEDNGTALECRATNNGYPRYKITLDTPLELNRAYELRMTRVGNTLTAYVDGVAQSQTQTVGATDNFAGVRINNINNNAGVIGHIYDLTVAVDGVVQGQYQGYGNTDADWVDISGNGNHGTVEGSPDLVRVPPQSGSDTLDAFGGNLTYTGRVPMDGIGKGPAWQGNGTDVSVVIPSADNAWPATADFVWTMPCYISTGLGKKNLFQANGASSDRLILNDSGTDVHRWIIQGSGTKPNVNTSSLDDGWYTFRGTRSGDDFTLEVLDFNQNVLLSDTRTIASVTFPSGYLWLGNGSNGHTETSFGPFKITTGGVTTEYHPIEGTRHVAKLTSDSSDTSIIYDAVVGGTLSTLYTLGDGSWELPHLKNGCRWASQNLVRNSAELTNATWVDTSNVTAEDNITDSDGGTNACRLTADSSSVSDPHYFGSDGVDYDGAGTSYANQTLYLQVSIKADGTDYAYFGLGGGSRGAGIKVDLTNGSYTEIEVGDSTLDSVDVIARGDWWDVRLRVSIGIAPNTGLVVFPGTASSPTGSLNISYATDGTQKIIVEKISISNEGFVTSNITNANVWEASALVPCDDTGASADGNTPNIEAGDHPRGLTVRREGSVADDISKAIGLDVWGDEVFDDVIQRNDLAKRRVNEFSSDRYAAKIDGNIKNNAYFDNDYRTVNASAGTFTSPNSTGEQDVTDLEFEPKITGIFGVGRTIDGNATHAQIGFGVAANASEQSTVSGSSEGNASPSEANRTYSQSEVVTLLNTSASLEDAEFVNNLSNGFRLNWTKANASEYIYNRFNLGGLDLERSVAFHNMNGTLSDESFAHGLSGKPTLLIMFTHGNSALGSNAGAIWALGAWANGSQISASFVSRDNVVTTEAYRYFSEQYTINRLSNAGSLLRAMTVNSVDEDEVQVSYSGSNTTQFKFTMLAVRGCTAQVGAFNCDGGEIDIPHVGMTPRLWLPIPFRNAEGSPDTTLGDVLYGLGACDGTNNVSCFYSDQDAKDTTVGGTRARKEQRSDEIRVVTTTGSAVLRATATFSTDNVKVTPTTTSGTYDQGGYITIGD